MGRPDGRQANGPDDGIAERLDELEEQVLGERVDQVRDEEDDESPAFDQDLEGQREEGSGAEPS